MSSFAGTRKLRRAGVAILMLLVIASSADGRPASPPVQGGALIDIPYLSQTPQLCGGAAMAMVLRYWGATTAQPQDFSHLIDEAAGGISAGRLIDAVRSDGWQAMAASSSLPSLATHVQQGRPVVALIEDSPGTFHYVVVVGTTTSSVVVHDPARAPYIVWTHGEFDRRWAASSRLMILVLPPVTSAGAADAASSAAPKPAAVPLVVAVPSRATAFVGTPTAASPSACDALVGRGVALATDDTDAAEQVLRSAMALCPGDAGAFRELAGVRLLQQRWDESIALALEAVARDADDRHARELLATSRFAAGDRLGALQAWNVLGSPSIDQVAIEGLRRTHQPILTGVLGLRPGTLLTAAAFTRALRRLEDFPTGLRPRLRYAPIEGERASVHVFADERRLMPDGVIGWARVAARAAITHEIRLDIAAPFSQGDLWQPSLRWPAARRRVGLAFALPVPGTRPGMLHLEIFRERQTYAPSRPEAAHIEATRRRVAVGYTDWVTGSLRVELGAASDRHDTRRYVALRAGGSWRLLRDHLTAHLRGERWLTAGSGGRGFQTLDASIDARSASEAGVPSWRGRVGWSQASDAAPLALWPGAGASLDRTALLRARRLIVDDVLSGEVFGRRLAYGSAERQHPVRRSPYGTLAVAAFVDAARASRRLTSTRPTPLHVDAGVGLRIDRPGEAAQIRFDVGVGLRDGRVRASAGYLSRWGRR